MTSLPTLLPEAETRTEPRVVPRYKVILFNDEVTTFEFVIDLLIKLFHKQRIEAVRLTHEVHNTGLAVITITTLERAELYIEQIRSLARPQGFPLAATLEPE